MAEPTRAQIAQDYTKALAIINDLRAWNTELLAAARRAVDVIGGTRGELGLALEAEKAYLALRAATAPRAAELER